MRGRIEMLGGFRVLQGERSITRFRTQKSAALLAYLAFHRAHRHPREHLIELLWPEAEPDAGRNRLRMALTFLRHPLEPPGVPAGAVLVADRNFICLNPDAVTTDVMEFIAALKQAESAENEDARADCLSRAVELYRGDLLPGFYDDWVQTEQRRLSEQLLQAIRRLIGCCEAAGARERALNYALRAVALDTMCEKSHRDVIRLYAELGRPTEALRQFQDLERNLREELGSRPSADTRAFVESLQQDTGLDARRTTQSARRQSRTVQPATQEPGQISQSTQHTTEIARESDGATASSRTSLPLQFTRLFGRDEEVADLCKLLSAISADLKAGARLVTLVGSGGIGKTRLAIETARQAAEHFPGGVWFVPLADLADPRMIPGIVMDSLRLPRSSNRDPIDQIVEFLNGRTAPAGGAPAACLLVLDNMEHLLADDRRKAEDGAIAARVLMERSPRLTLLVSSRQLLGLEGERVFPVFPLNTPGIECRTPSQLTQVASVQLFVDRAQAIRPDFQVTSGNAADIAGLCGRLEGIPLAIELAAMRANVLSPRQMLAELERRFDFLVSRRRDAIDRHRTLHAAIEWSYMLLSPELRRYFARLSVFRGGWTAEASDAVCADWAAARQGARPNFEGGGSAPARSPKGCGLDALASLQECSLIHTEGSAGEQRFRMLEALREYAGERLSPQARADTDRRHTEFFLALAEEAATKLQGSDQAVWLDRLEAEHDNLRTALSRSLNGGARAISMRFCAALWRFWFARGHFREGRSWFEAALALDGAQVPEELYAAVLNGAGGMAHLQGDYAAAQAYYEQSLAIRRDIGDMAGAAASLNGLGKGAFAQGNYSAAKQYYLESLQINRDIKNRTAEAINLDNLGILFRHQGDYESAREYCKQGVDIRRDIGDRRGLSDSLASLGNIAFNQGDYSTAHDSYQQSLEIATEIGDQLGIAALLSNIGNVALVQDYAAARSWYEQSLVIRQAIGDPAGIAGALLGLGNAARLLGEYARARDYYAKSMRIRHELNNLRDIAYLLRMYAYLLSAEAAIEQPKHSTSKHVRDRLISAAKLGAAAQSLTERIGAPLPPNDREDHLREIASVRERLGEVEWDRAWTAGLTMTTDDAVALALDTGA